MSMDHRSSESEVSESFQKTLDERAEDILEDGDFVTFEEHKEERRSD